MTGYRRVVLARRPQGVPQLTDFAIDTATLIPPKRGEIVTRNRYVSLDPGLRQRLSQVDSYVKLIELGTPLTTTVLGEVVGSAHPDYAVGDDVVSFGTIAEYSVFEPGPLTRKVDLSSTASPSNHLSILGPTGLTAYLGLPRQHLLSAKARISADPTVM